MNKEETTFKDILQIMRENLKLILISGVVGIALSAVFTFIIIDSQYSSETQLIATLPTAEETNAGNIDTNLRLLKTYKDFVKGNLVLSHVSEKMEKEHQVKISPGELNKSIQVVQADDSQMFSIKAESTDPDTAANIANVTAEVFQEDIKEVLKADQIVIVSEAIPNTNPISPNKTLNLLIGLVLGILVGMLIALISNFFNRRLNNVQFIEEYMDSPVLGNIPVLSSKELKESILNMNKMKNQREENSGKKVLSRRTRR